MKEKPLEIGTEAKLSIESEITKNIDDLISQLDTYVAEYDLKDVVDVETLHLEKEWVENLADFDLHFLEESIKTGFVGKMPIDLNPRTIALQLAALQLKRKRVVEAND